MLWSISGGFFEPTFFGAGLADLREGELIHGDNFNLFAAMSALEVFFQWEVFRFLCGPFM